MVTEQGGLGRTGQIRRRGLIVLALGLVGAAALAAVLIANRPPAVPTVVVTPQKTERVLAVVGRVRPVERVEVRPINPGQVVRLLHDEGDRVAAGEPLAVIRAVVEQAQTEAERARVQAARARAAEARRNFNRTQTLSERGFASQAALDQARAELRTAEAETRAAEALERAAAERAGEFIVRAPAASIVLARPIDTGQVVSTTTTLFELGSGGAGEVEAEVDEAYGDAVRPGMAARLAATGSQTVLPATVFEVSPKVDASTGGRTVRLRYDGAIDLVPGRSVDVTIVVRPAEPLILAPRSAVVGATVAPTVYVVDDNDVVRERRVRIADWPSTDAIVEDGLAVGERLVLAPGGLKPGERVRPAPARR